MLHHFTTCFAVFVVVAVVVVAPVCTFVCGPPVTSLACMRYSPFFPYFLPPKKKKRKKKINGIHCETLNILKAHFFFVQGASGKKKELSLLIAFLKPRLGLVAFEQILK